MSKSAIQQEISDKKRTALKERVSNSAPVQIVKGLWTFAEGSALLITSTFAIYQAYTQSYAKVWQVALIVAGALVLVPAAILLSKFFRAVGKA